MVSLCFWRRRRDSNSRTSFPAYSLSRGAPSTYLGTSPYSVLFPPLLQRKMTKRCFAGGGIGGEGGIRTHGSFESPVFKTGSLNRSDTSPCRNKGIITKKRRSVNCFFKKYHFCFWTSRGFYAALHFRTKKVCAKMQRPANKIEIEFSGKRGKPRVPSRTNSFPRCR